MLDISGPEFLVLVVAALFILGPERIPGAARWLGQTVRKVRDYATGARDQLAAEVGEDFDELRKPLQNLARLRNVDGRRMLTQHLLDATGGYDPQQDIRDIIAPQPESPSASNPPSLRMGERPPFDPDAT
jgi:sec-independent protein translocase protein TatB